MIVDDLLRILSDRAVELNLDGDRLRFRAPEGALTCELRDEIAANRPMIIERLGKPSTNAAVVARCAICDWQNWRDDPPKDGRIRTTCGKCGRFIGYRPVDARMA